MQLLVSILKKKSIRKQVQAKESWTTAFRATPGRRLLQNVSATYSPKSCSRASCSLQTSSMFSPYTILFHPTSTKREALPEFRRLCWFDVPFKRVPIGSPALLINTQALSSKRTKLPSGRPYFFFVRTTTAWEMSPRRTFWAAAAAPAKSAARLRCFWTTTTMRSPGVA